MSEKDSDKSKLVKRKRMIVTAWKSQPHNDTGTGYGLTIQRTDRDRYFKRVWGTVTIELQGESEPVKANIDKDGFWNGCPHLINKQIGLWMIKHRFAPWAKRYPPKFYLDSVGDGDFILTAKGKLGRH